MAGANFLASGPINTSVFVKLDSSNSNQVLQCTGSDQPYGISQEFPLYGPYAPGISTLAAVAAGNTIQVYQATDICLLLCSSGNSWTAGQFLMPTTDGSGIPATSSNAYGAIALETVNASTGSILGKVAVVFGPNY